MGSAANAVCGRGLPPAGRRRRPGTTNDYNDVWFIGYTADLVAGVWMGMDNPQKIMHDRAGRPARRAGVDVVHDARSTSASRRRPTGRDRPTSRREWSTAAPGCSTARAARSRTRTRSTSCRGRSRPRSVRAEQRSWGSPEMTARQLSVQLPNAREVVPYPRDAGPCDRTSRTARSWSRRRSSRSSGSRAGAPPGRDVRPRRRDPRPRPRQRAHPSRPHRPARTFRGAAVLRVDPRAHRGAQRALARRTARERARRHPRGTARRDHDVRRHRAERRAVRGDARARRARHRVSRGVRAGSRAVRRVDGRASATPSPRCANARRRSCAPESRRTRPIR